jgi:hypothetical protein
MQGRGGRRPRRAAATPPPRRLIEFLAQMPTDTKIFLTMAVLGLATVLGLAYSPPRPGPRGRDPRVVGGFGVANLACDLGAGDTRSPACLSIWDQNPRL